MARVIEIWSTDRLVPYAKNARTHSSEQVAQIAASIVEFGFVNPILVDSMDGIIAGHGRLLAAGPGQPDAGAGCGHHGMAESRGGRGVHAGGVPRLVIRAEALFGDRVIGPQNQSLRH